jgi:hypothetical protein
MGKNDDNHEGARVAGYHLLMNEFIPINSKSQVTSTLHQTAARPLEN